RDRARAAGEDRRSERRRPARAHDPVRRRPDHPGERAGPSLRPLQTRSGRALESPAHVGARQHRRQHPRRLDPVLDRHGALRSAVHQAGAGGGPLRRQDHLLVVRMGHAHARPRQHRHRHRHQRPDVRQVAARRGGIRIPVHQQGRQPVRRAAGRRPGRPAARV
ncbi:hypothetical protein OY671_011364, partial [Metschnikowia pulcherrima]